MGELYSISGLFYESFPGIIPWGGYFIRGIDGDDNGIEGMLIDVHGPSLISGAMTEKELSFIKRYGNENRAQSFDYQFILDNGIWKGEYKSTSNSYGARSFCKTSLCIEDLSFRKFDLRTPDGYAKALVDSMVESGQLERFNDPETGEEMIKPL